MLLYKHPAVQEAGAHDVEDAAVDGDRRVDDAGQRGRRHRLSGHSDPGAEHDVLTRGPIHEAFAEQYNDEPTAGRLVEFLTAVAPSPTFSRRS
jgi:hypothetical protein